MKEIIIITNNLADNGAARVLSELSKEWVHQGHKVSVLQIRSEYFPDNYDVPKDVEIININSGTKNRTIRRFIQAFRVVRILRQRGDATIVAFLNPACLLCAICSPFVKNKIVFSERNDPERSPAKKIYRLVRDNLFRLADVCVFQTSSAQAHFCKSVQRKGIIIPNPVNDKLPVPYDGVRRKAIVMACRLDQQKNIPMTIHAFNKLLADYSDYVLEIYGRGEQEEDLKLLIHSLGLEEKVFLKGFSYDVHKAMQDAAMYVSSSNYEGISNSMLEALGMGVPTVCTDCPCGGARAYIENEINGLLIPVGDVEALYLAMKRVLDDEEFSQQLSENSRRILDELPVQVIAKKWLEIF